MTPDEIVADLKAALHVAREGLDMAAPYAANVNPLAGFLVGLADVAVDLADDAVRGEKSSAEKWAALEAAVAKSTATARKVATEVSALEDKMEEDVKAAGPK
jgi:phage shock protein A